MIEKQFLYFFKETSKFPSHEAIYFLARIFPFTTAVHMFYRGRDSFLKLNFLNSLTIRRVIQKALSWCPSLPILQRP